MANLLPRPTESVILPDGRINPTWYRFFAQFQRDFDESAVSAGAGLSKSSGGVFSVSTGGVTRTMLASGLGCSVIGRYADSTGPVGDIVAAANGRVLMRDGDILVFREISTAMVPSAALTKADDTNVTLTLGGSPATALLAATSITVGWSGQLSAARGGTGIGSYAVGDLLYASGATTLAKLADVATGNALLSGGIGVAPAWGKIGLTTHVSGTLPTGNGGTGVTALGDITRANDTNVTLTLGGTPVGSVISSVSFTLGWAGQLAAARGGTGVAALGDISRVNDTNVTLTLGGTPTGAVINSTSFTLGWSGTLSIARGGTGGGAASGTLLDNITGFASTGHLVRTGAGTYAFRTVTGTASQITVTNGDGVSGNPTLSIPSAFTAPGTITSTTDITVGQDFYLNRSGAASAFIVNGFANYRFFVLGGANGCNVGVDANNRFTLNNGAAVTGQVSYFDGLEPGTNDTYYLGRNDDDSPRAWKGVIMRDQSTGTYYRLDIFGGTVRLVDLTD